MTIALSRKINLVSLLLAIFVVPLPSQDTAIDQPTADVSLEELRQHLQAEDIDAAEAVLYAADAEVAKRMEDLILESARLAILQERHELAQSLAGIVLMFNLDNMQAQDLYTAVEDAKRQKAALEERKRQDAEAARLAAEAEAARLAEEERVRQEALDAAEKARIEAEAAEAERIASDERARRFAEEEARKQAEEAAFLRQVTEIGLRNFSLRAGIAPFGVQAAASQFADQFNEVPGFNARYGFAADFQLRFEHPYLAAGLGGNAQFYPLRLSGNAQSYQLDGRLAVSSPLLTGPLALGGGYRYAGYLIPESNPTGVVLITELGSPMVGLGWEHWELFGIVDSSFYFDWLAVSAVTELIDFGFSAHLRLAKLFPAGERGLDWYVQLDNRYDMLFSGDYSEWSLYTTVLVGVLVHEK